MSLVLLLRLTFDLAALGLLLFGFSYWWLGDMAHELAGSSLFLLLIVHNLFNRRFYGTIARSRQTVPGLVNAAVTVALLIMMSVLLVTSALMSDILSGIMPTSGGFTVRQLHVLAAYWTLIIVGVHLGLRWPMIMRTARGLAGLSRPNPARTWLLRLAAFAIAVHGVWSFFALDLGTKLAMRVSLDWWNFDEAVAGFFVHCAAVAGLCTFVTYYTLRWLRRPDHSASPA